MDHLDLVVLKYVELVMISLLRRVQYGIVQNVNLKTQFVQDVVKIKMKIPVITVIIKMILNIKRLKI